MDPIKTIDGKVVTEEMLDRWSEALDRDEWPDGEHNVGDIVVGCPPSSVEGSTVLSVKIPISIKRALESRAKTRGQSISEYVRTVIVEELVHD